MVQSGVSQDIVNRVAAEAERAAPVAAVRTAGTVRSRDDALRKQRRRMSHERRVLLMALAGGLPAMSVAFVLMWAGGYSTKLCLTLSALLAGCWLGFSFALRERVVRPLQTISNLLAALGEGDFSIRARGAAGDDALGEVMREVNSLSETLRRQRIVAIEATVLLRTVMEEIDVSVFAFDETGRLRLVNRAGARLLTQKTERLIGRTAEQLSLSDCLADANETDAGTVSTLQKTFPGNANDRWGVRRSEFRLHGRPHRLLVLADLSRPLRQEEAHAWQRLVRVLGHELNNSLAPIKSIADSLATLLARETPAPDWKDDMRRGLSVVSGRAESLSRFMEAYARLARLPAPRFRAVEVSALLRRVARLETRLSVRVAGGAEQVVSADPDQLEQLLINVIRNAADASLETGGAVGASWRQSGSYVEVLIEDEGLGLASTANLFVPFFTTKPNGSGIGLVLSRQIAEAHGGMLTLENRRGGTGCRARLRLPL